MEDGERTAQQYDAMATTYAKHNEVSGANAHYERPATISLLGEVHGLRVLEVGCGAGPLTEWLVDHGAEVTAMDISRMLAMGRVLWRIRKSVEPGTRPSYCRLMRAARSLSSLSVF